MHATHTLRYKHEQTNYTQVCNHPFCMPESEPDGEGNSPVELLVEASGGLM